MPTEFEQTRFACKPQALARLAVALAVAGCSVLDGGMGHRGTSAPTASTPSHFDATLVNQCKTPVVVCYGTKEKCSSIAPGEKRLVHGPGAGLPVRLKDADVSVSADATFSIVEINESCTTLVRQIADEAPDPDGNVH